MKVSNEHEKRCAACGAKITGEAVVLQADEGPNPAQMEKLKPTVYLCVECARERGLREANERRDGR